MNKIRVLPEILANKIAAGEIVERPASVVKELMENSIDAGSSSIHVAIQSGGKRLIRVSDDGMGMTQDDAILAFEHHATSKLQTAEDLSAIATLGFRGEALPSIASVSRLTLRTRPDDSDAVSGTELEIHGGILRSVKPISWDKGTEMEVRDLFFNVPARRKFLKTNDTESGHIARHVTHYALAHPEMRFTLQSGDRVLLDTVAVSTVRERIYQVFGDGFLDNMVELSGSDGPVRIHGFSSRPHEQRTNAYSQHFYVNGRMVRDKVITGAVRQAYRRSMPAAAFPVVILFLELPFDQVDVNAHPAKTEIRFHNQRSVFNLVQNSIERALSRDVAIPEFEPRGIPPYTSDLTATGMQSVHDSREIIEMKGLDSAPVSGNFSDALQPSLQYPFQEIANKFQATREDHATLRVQPDMLLDSKGESGGLFHTESIRILGQFRDSYIIAGDRQGLLIIDQHVAHERILYEKLANSMRDRNVEIQGLLTPFSIDLLPHQIALIEKVMPELNRSGFQVEPFGGASILVRSVPAIAGEADCRELLKEILENLEQEDRGLDIERIRDRIAVGAACRAAVKINMPLSMEKMQWLIDQLAHTRIPTSCPHGRPIILRFSNYEIEKKFGRV
jgi:DNA mismatch repair protein MutL